METISPFLDGLKTICWNLFIGANYESAFLYALAIVVLFTFYGFYKRGRNRAWLNKQFKGIGVTIFFVLVNSFGFALFVYMATEYAQAGYNSLGLPHVSPTFWADVPLWVTLPLIVLIYDFANYWNHRLMHMDWLWPVHAIHHSETEMNGMTTYRVHFLESLVMNLSYVLLLSWLGLPKEALGIGVLFLSLHNVYTHMDLDWDHGPFRYLLASPRFHRWHHADVPEAHGKNLSNIFPIYDVLFGTYYVPGTCDVKLGATGVPENDGAKLVLYPFKALYDYLYKVMPVLWRFLSNGMSHVFDEILRFKKLLRD